MRLFILVAGFSVAACAPVAVQTVPEPMPIKAVGYSSENTYKNYAAPQRRLMAIRGAKLEAMRNLAEELYGTRITGHTTVKDMMVENDSYRSYVDAVIRGAHLVTITPKGDGVYEAEVELRMNRQALGCMHTFANGCQSDGLRGYPVIGVGVTSPNCYNCSPNDWAASTCQGGSCPASAYPEVYYFYQ